MENWDPLARHYDEPRDPAFYKAFSCGSVCVCVLLFVSRHASLSFICINFNHPLPWLEDLVENVNIQYTYI